MTPLDEVRREILAAVSRLPVERVARRDALGLVLAEEVVAREPVPPFANSAMDGYAVRAADTAGASESSPLRLRVVGELPAGRAPTVPVGGGEAIRIMTGAPVPDGADAIVIVELTAPDGADGVLVQRAASTGDHIRPAGGDLEAGRTVFGPGTRLRAAHLGVLASLDVHDVAVVKRARVGVMSTGDEVVEEGPLAPGRIRDSNRPMLLALVAEAGCEPVDLGIARDDEALITATLERALSECDAVLTSGGVSVGDFDYVKATLERMGVLRWFQVAIRPAKPLAFGVVGGTPVFGLPGNPVSSHVSFELFARPALLSMMGRDDVLRPEVVATAGHAMRRRADGKLHLDRVRVRAAGEGLVAERSGGQESNVLSAMAAANGLVLLPDGEGVDAGAPVRVMLLEAEADRPAPTA